MSVITAAVVGGLYDEKQVALNDLRKAYEGIVEILAKYIDAVKKGDTVVTSGGIIGKVAKVKDDGELLIEIADNVQVRVVKGTLSDVRAKGEA